MLTRTRLASGALAAAALATTVALAVPASAAGSTAPLVGGNTHVTASGATTRALVGAGISVAATGEGTLALLDKGPRVRFAFPVTGGSLDPDSGAAIVEHSGGVQFTNTANGSSVVVQDFTIELGPGTANDVTGWVPALGVRVPVFDLVADGARISVTGSKVQVGNVGLVLNDGAAAALDAALGTNAFAGGLDFGTARAIVRVGAAS